MPWDGLGHVTRCTPLMLAALTTTTLTTGLFAQVQDTILYGNLTIYENKKCEYCSCSKNQT
jgi:hypothetical protein